MKKTREDLNCKRLELAELQAQLEAYRAFCEAKDAQVAETAVHLLGGILGSLETECRATMKKITVRYFPQNVQTLYVLHLFVAGQN